MTFRTSDRNWFYIVTLVIIMLMNLCNGIYQNSIYGIVADFPENYPNSLIIGNNLCGIFTSGMSIFTTVVSPNSVMLNALLYFSISLAILVICGLSLIVLVRLVSIAFIRSLSLITVMSWPSANELVKMMTPNAPASSNTWTALAMRNPVTIQCWVQLFNNFFVYFISLIIFPAMMSETPFYRQPGDPWGSVFPENLYFAINTFLNFNVFASFGSLTANYVHFPKPRFLWIPVVARVLFIPFFMFCNYQPVGKQRTIGVSHKYLRCVENTKNSSVGILTDVVYACFRMHILFCMAIIFKACIPALRNKYLQRTPKNKL
ncbi:nucleoside transporter [Oesophagostomum dentatum]|uniref:Nucleoside transporter n=1 Tax=Oesophagostomum dentatum TaxID=61180 RepID=A0A0B1SWF9_OESDE|nr:nucleoside transporter [Oesophagostomum dentatum]